MKIETLAWHYTVGNHFLKIMESGYLRPTDIGIEPGEKPILWFSTNQTWDQTACKAVLKDGKICRISKEETRNLGGGLYRFGMPIDRLHMWPKLVRKARMTPNVQRLLEIEGRKQGANPSEWCGLTSNPIAIDKIFAIQTEADGLWVDIHR